jgi:hypothetical protein
LTTPYELYQRLLFPWLSSSSLLIVCDHNLARYMYHSHSWAIVFIDSFNINLKVSLAFVHIRYTTSVTVIRLMSSTGCLYSLNASVNGKE